MSKRKLEEEAREIARKLASLETQLIRIASKAAQDETAGRAAERLFHEHRDAVVRKANALLEFRPLWWQKLCSPLHVWLLTRERRKQLTRDTVTGDELTRIDRLVSRLRFGYALDSVLAARLARLIEAGDLTARDVWRLTHSLGCRVVGGELDPAPVSRATALTGLSVSLGLIGFCSLFSYAAVIALRSPCLDVCFFTGNVVLAYAAAHAAPLILCLTWGRRDAGLMLEQVMNTDFERQLRTKARPLLARLCW